MEALEWIVLILVMMTVSLTSGFIAGFIIVRNMAPTEEQVHEYNERLDEDLYLDASGKFFTNRVIDRD